MTGEGLGEARTWTTAIASQAARSGSWATWTTPGSRRSPMRSRRGPERSIAPGDLPESLAELSPAPAVLVLHRSVLTGRDALVMKRLRSDRAPAPRVVLCHGPHVRYADLERWAELFDAALPEATARETVARRLAAPGEGLERRPVASPRPRVAVVSTNLALRQTLAEAIEAAGYPAVTARDWNEAPATGPVVWDVPLLEPEWPQALARRGPADPVVALLGFADRALVTEARARGAAACLELPLDLADLIATLDRLTAPRVEPGHALPPAPARLRRPARSVADAGRGA